MKIQAILISKMVVAVLLAVGFGASALDPAALLGAPPRSPVAAVTAGSRLSGKTIVVNPGHGWHLAGSQWRLQRSYYFGVVEDFLTS